MSDVRAVLSRHTAAHDDRLRVVVTAQTPLWYADGANHAHDRPAHVRAASSLAWIGDTIAVIQDDANFAALVDPSTRAARAIVLPRGEGGLRQFDDTRGNKKYKWDLEACVAVPTNGVDVLWAWGSGSKKRRRRVAMIDCWDTDTARVVLVDANALYERLEETEAFAGSDMNIEGAMLVGDVLRLFNRGNGAAKRERLPVNATCDLLLRDVRKHFEDSAAAVPTPTNIVQYDLGALHGVPLGFTDAIAMGDATLFAATAEASEDATTDGLVTGSVLGVIASDGTCRYGLLYDAQGRPFSAKVEGVLLAKTSRTHGWLVVDADDPTAPSHLCEFELVGPWQS